MNVIAKLEPNPAFSHPASEARLAKTVAALEKHGIEVIVVATKDEARDRVLALIPAGAEVMTNTSVTLDETGIATAINESGRYEALRPKLFRLDFKTQVREMRKLAAAPDYAVGSVHAITEAGEVLIASASGSQLGPYPYAAGNVIWVAGTQKIVKDIDDGIRRIREYSFPLEDQRAQAAYGMNSLVSKILVFLEERGAGRFTLVLIKEKIGF